MRLIDAEALLIKLADKKDLIQINYDGIEAAAAIRTLTAFTRLVETAPTVDISTYEGCKDCLFYCDHICVDNIMKNKCRFFDERKKYEK